MSGLAKAIDNARILQGFKNDDVAAFRALSSALRRPKPYDTDVERALALTFLIDIAPSAGRGGEVPALVDQLRVLPVSAQELESAVATAADPGALRELLGHGDRAAES